MSKRLTQKVLLIGWDAADWKVILPLVESGEMPTLAKMMQDGAWGNIATLEPPLSPILWTSIATGKLPHKHGVLGFTEPDAEAGGIRPVRSTSRKAKALWNIFTQLDMKSNVVAWWPSNPVEKICGTMVSNLFHKSADAKNENWQMPPSSVHPSSLEETIAELRVHPSELTPQHIFPFIPDFDKVNYEKDNRPDILLKMLAEAASVHSVATHLMETEEYEFTAVYFDSIDHFSHGFMKYHPPKYIESMSEEDFNLYKDVVKGAYKFHDMMLERMLELTDENTTIILMSDHGFHSDHLRPKYLPKEPAGPAYEHRPYGIFCMKGPNVKRGEKIFGATLLDVAPTILTLFGLPVGKDMDGKALVSAFSSEVKPDFIDSWENVEGESGMHPEDFREDPWQAQEALKQLVALGYIEDPGKDKNHAAEVSVTEAEYNMARSYVSVNMLSEALPILEKLYEKYPKEIRFARYYLICLEGLQKYDRCKKVLDELKVRLEKQPPSLLFYEGNLLMNQHRYQSALEIFQKLLERNSAYPGLYNEIGKAFFSLGHTGEAFKAFEKSLEIDHDNALAWFWMGRTNAIQENHEEAVECYLQSIERMYHNPGAHFRLGESLIMLQDKEHALQAFRTAVQQSPGMNRAHQWLIKIYSEQNNTAMAQHHQEVLQKNPQQAITIVSGLPRSGTSVMMQMLQLGGADILCDELRKADNNNPKGYMEYEPVKKLSENASWLNEMSGKTVKIIAQLLGFLPSENQYKIVFMERNLDEVLASQQVMLTGSAKAYPAVLAHTFEKQVAKTKAWLASQPNIEVLYVQYAEVIQQPEIVAQQVADFTNQNLNTNEMIKAVDKKLYRNSNPVWK